MACGIKYNVKTFFKSLDCYISHVGTKEETSHVISIMGLNGFFLTTHRWTIELPWSDTMKTHKQLILIVLLELIRLFSHVHTCIYNVYNMDTEYRGNDPEDDLYFDF